MGEEKDSTETYCDLDELDNIADEATVNSVFNINCSGKNSELDISSHDMTEDDLPPGEVLNTQSFYVSSRTRRKSIPTLLGESLAVIPYQEWCYK